MALLFGDIERHKALLQSQAKTLVTRYGGKTSLPGHFSAIPGRIICICPMVLCEAFLADLKLEAPDNLLVGVGLAMYSISTHDDVVDERPADRGDVAALTYAGNIASLAGIRHLIVCDYGHVATAIIDLMNTNHCFQTDIVYSLWTRPCNESEYLEAIAHTGFWAAIGPIAAVAYVESMRGRPSMNLVQFAMDFGELYGCLCQVLDDLREIDDDIRNGYYSLPISTALMNNLDILTSEGLSAATVRSREIANRCYEQLAKLCDKDWPHLLALVTRMHAVGLTI